MAYLYLDSAKTKYVLSDQDALIRELNSLMRQVDSVRTNLRYKIACQATISARLLDTKNQIGLEAQRSAQMRDAFSQIIALYQQTETKNMGLLQADKVKAQKSDIIQGAGNAQDKTTKTFDDDKDNGTYGADQGDMDHHKKGIWFFGFRWFEDEDLYAYIREHDRYKNYSQTQIAKLMEQINKEGCGYVAIVNNIFVEFEGREEEFERIFGFPMYDKDGKANYDYLLVDFYANTDDQYYLDEPLGATALVNDVIQEYLDNKKGVEFIRKYGCVPIVDGKYINPEARQKILDEYQNTSVVTKEVSGTTNYSLENRFRHYMEQKGITSYSANSLGGDPMPSASDINSRLDNGQNVNITVGGFNLYNEDGSIAKQDVGDHWMTITGTAEDGRYIVSSWGGRYYLNPSELDGASFFVIDIT